MFALTYNLVLAGDAGGVGSAEGGGGSGSVSSMRCVGFMESPSGASLPKLVVNRDRPGRCAEPRVRKRRPKSYPLMTRPRNELREKLEEQKEVA